MDDISSSTDMQYMILYKGSLKFKPKYRLPCLAQYAIHVFIGLSHKLLFDNFLFTRLPYMP